MYKLWIDNEHNLGVPLLFCLQQHRMVSGLTGHRAVFKRELQPITNTGELVVRDNPRLTLVEDADDAEQHFLFRVTYPQFFWWYMINEGLVGDRWQQEHSTYAELDTRHKILYDEYIKRQERLLDVWADTATLVPWYGWRIDPIKVGYILPPDMECGMAADAWLAWLDRHVPESIRNTRHVPAK